MQSSTKIAVWLLTGAALAAATVITYADHEPEPGLYLDAAYGQTSIKDADPGLGIAEDGDAFRVGLGYDLGNDIAVEAGYLRLGELGDDSLDVVTDGWTLSGRFTLPLSTSLSASARAGVFFWETDLPFGGTNFETSGEDALLGVGLQFNATRNLTLGLDWDRIGFDNGDVDILSFGAKFRF